MPQEKLRKQLVWTSRRYPQEEWDLIGFNKKLLGLTHFNLILITNCDIPSSAAGLVQWWTPDDGRVRPIRVENEEVIVMSCIGDGCTCIDATGCLNTRVYDVSSVGDPIIPLYSVKLFVHPHKQTSTGSKILYLKLRVVKEMCTWEICELTCWYMRTSGTFANRISSTLVGALEHATRFSAFCNHITQDYCSPFLTSHYLPTRQSVL